MSLVVVVPIFNEEHRIQRFIQRLSKQLKKNDGLIFVDNNCTDNTIILIKQFKNRNHKLGIEIIEEKRQGTSYARKTGFDYAANQDYEIIVSCDSDTIFPSKVLNFIEATFIDQPKTDYLIGQLHFPQKSLLALYLTNKDLMVLDKQFFYGEDKYFGPRFYGGYFAIRAKFYLEIPDFAPNNLMPYEDILLARRCFYCGGNFIRSQKSVETSDRRIMADVNSWFSRDRLSLTYHEPNRLKITDFRIFGAKKKLVIARRVENGVDRFIATWIDAYYFSKKFPQYKQRPQNACRLAAKEIFGTDLHSVEKKINYDSQESWQILKKIYGTNVESNIKRLKWS